MNIYDVYCKLQDVTSNVQRMNADLLRLEHRFLMAESERDALINENAHLREGWESQSDLRLRLANANKQIDALVGKNAAQVKIIGEQGERLKHERSESVRVIRMLHDALRRCRAINPGEDILTPLAAADRLLQQAGYEHSDSAPFLEHGDGKP